METTTVVPLRPYQRRIAEQVIAARSAVVLLPTGAGKTNIAAAYLRHFFLTVATARTQQRRQAVFVVPTIPLIKQQLAALQPYLPRDVMIVHVQGGKKVSLVPASRPALYIGVPEAMRRLLNETRADGRLMDNIGALVLDEVHHAHDAHPYKKILGVVARALDGAPCRDVVATLGLTASLCHARTLPDIRKRIAKLLVQLGAGPSDVYSATETEIGRDGCTLPAPPTELAIDVSGLNLVTGDPQAPLLSLARAAKAGEGNVLPFTIALFHAVMKFEAQLQHLPQFPMSITETWHKSRAVAASLIAKDLKPFLDSAEGRGLCRLMDALKLTAVSNQLGADTAWFYLAHFPEVRADLDNACIACPSLAAVIASVFEASDASFELEPLSALPAACRRLSAVPHRYAALARSVWENCLAPTDTTTDDGTKRRAIVFVREVVSAHIIEGFLNRLFTAPGQPRVARSFVSKGADPPSPLAQKMSATDAEEVLTQFREGHVRVMVSTTVAEEGLDVARCSAVIHFERPSNPVAFAQRTGRARAVDSVAIIMDGTIAEHQQALKFQRQVVDETPLLAAAMADVRRDPNLLKQLLPPG